MTTLLIPATTQDREGEAMKECPIRPLGDHVVLRLAEPIKQIGRILMPDTYQKKPQKGKVLAVGPDCKTQPCEKHTRLSAGMIVLFNEFAGSVHPDDKTILILREDELLAYEDEM
jgi:chaperonin GroES